MNRSRRPINRRDFLEWTAAASVGALVGAARGKGRPTADRPNVLWITAEDMSPYLGCWGDKYARTPNIDAMARESVRYTRVFATAPVCSPVRSCLITGVYATSLGTPNLRSKFPIPANIKGFPTYLRRAGYFTSNNVKTDYNTSNEPAIVRESWDVCSNKGHWRGRKAGQPFFCVFNDMVSHQSRTMVWPYAQFKSKVQSLLAPGERHDPAKAPLPPYYPDTPITRRTIARCYDCITVMDKNVGKLLKQLDDDGLADETIVFFYSDHGSGIPRHKRLLLDSGMHVPMLIRFPKKYQHLAPGKWGETVDRLISFVDFPPTVLSLVGLPVPKYMQGRAFLGRAAGKERRFVHGARDRVDEAYDLARSVRDENYLYVRTFMPHLSYNQPSYYCDLGEIRGEITRLAGAGKLTTAAQRHYAGPTRAIEELYDTRNDPHQINNLAGSPKHKSVREKMRAELKRWMAETHDLGLLPEVELARRSASATPHAIATDAGKYPQARILASADLVGRGVGVMPRQIKLLDDDDPAVRYWAAMGLRALGSKAAPAAERLVKALADAAPNVRIEAAAALAGMGRTKKALHVLAEELGNKDLRVVLHAARILQLLGEKARPVLAAMKRAQAAAKGGRGDAKMFIWFVLDPAVKKLSRR